MMIPYGYKQTEVGVIPEDWECTTAKQLMKIETGSRNTENKTNTGIYPFFVRSQKIESIDTYHYNCEAVLTAGDGVGTGKVFHYCIGKFDAHQRVYVMSGFNGISGRYFYYYFSENFEKEVSKYTAKSSVDSVRHDMIAEMKIPLPPLPEQQRIAEALSDVDGMISSLEKLIAKYKSIKTACLQQMFPQNGETVPRMRLPGFTGAWEQRKLGDIADIVGGGTPSTGNQSYWEGDIDWYAPAEIADQIYANSSQKKITSLGYENSSAKMLPPGTVLFTSRAGIGKTAILTRKACTNQGFQSIVPHRGELDSYFIFSRTEELKRYGELVGAGSTFVEVSGKQMAVMELMMPPTMREQKTIGDFFQQLDHLITLHQRKLEKVQKIKQGMMQQLLTGKIRLV